ncbi:MAG: EamA family transporter [Nocardioides sp.]|jgi:drug/metabolite transporter (DMT)-like permease|uniref:DMT family transporter n=1 Tax=Nocardioides sp. TaxID=35761 RepID=UPI0026060812|nr:DMT family transporter [Nocardioides sp.]MCW2832869.1 EamA family transporter [Nocardioides sp.]
MGIVLALLAALGYGLSDFVGGLAARRTSAWPVAVMCSVGAIVTTVLVALAFDGRATGADLAWGAFAGIGSGLGGGFLYRGLAAGRMGVVAPVSAVGAAIVPVVVGVATGERPELLVWIGIAAAVPGIWLVSREPGEGSLAAGLVDGVVAGLGFGLLFAAIGQVPEGAGYWPLALAQVTALFAVVAIATALRATWRPTARSEVTGGLLAGVLGSTAALCFLLATQSGLLSVAAVLASLYPAFTILLASTTLREHIHRGQAVGLVFCGLCVALVAAG